MAKWVEWTEEQRAGWNEWLASRPPVIQELAAKLPGDRLYRVKATGQRGTIYSYSESGTVMLVVDGTYCRVMFGQKVFGLSPDDLEECDLPGPDEEVGSFAAESEDNRAFVEGVYIPAMREKIQREKGKRA